MNIENELKTKLALFEQVKNRLGEVSKKIGALTEEQRAIYNQGLELKGAIDLLLQLQAKEAEDLKKSETAKLILPEGVKPVIPQESSVVEETPEKPVLETAEGSIELEVK